MRFCEEQAWFGLSEVLALQLSWFHSPMIDFTTMHWAVERKLTFAVEVFFAVVVFLAAGAADFAFEAAAGAFLAGAA